MWILLLAATLPDALLLQPYQPAPLPMTVSSHCSLAAPIMRLVEGQLPNGITLGTNGQFSGTPNTSGEFPFIVEASDGCTRQRQRHTLRVSAAPILVAETASTEYHCVQGAPPFAAEPIRISGSAPGLAYRLEGFQGPWLSWRQRFGQLPRAESSLESDFVTVEIDPGKLSPGVYTARLLVSAWQAANAPELTFKLHVAPAVTALPAAHMAPIPVPPATPVAAPSVTLIRPPAANWPPLPHFKPAVKRPRPARSNANSGPGRSRVLPFIKVPIIEPPPERTKPSAMPPAEAPAGPVMKPAPKPAAKPSPAAH